MSYPPNSGAQAPSFKTNVNRAKTKRWVEAKSYTYDGDDWGDADEYDEYGGYDEPPPPPRPTGLRQQGQSAHSVHQSPYGGPTDPYQRSMDTSRQEYGNASPAQQYGQRSATNPQPRVQTAFGRSNSFDQGDEKRAFSAGGFQPGMTSPGSAIRQQMPYNQDQQHGPANVQPPMQFDPTHMRPVQPDVRRQYPEPQRQYAAEPTQVADQGYDRPSNHREPSYPDGPRYPSRGSRAQSMTSNTSSMDIPNRRDFTPSALPPPLHPMGSPTSDSRSSSTHPPRKSSLSQTNLPSFPTPTQSTPSEPEVIQRQRTSSGADKPLPFVRPADIYKRMQEEKEKDRQSQESSRPSMDVIMRSPEYVTGHSNQALIEEEPDLDYPSMSPTPKPILDSIESREHGQMLQPEMDPVAELRSEYDLETVHGERRSSNNQEQAFEVLGQEGAPVQSQTSPRSTVQNTLSPLLPEVARMSSFGDSFLGSSGATGEPSLQAMLSSTSTISPSTDQKPAANEDSSGLQHQPSSGFRSVVNQAFDVADDQTPPTPTSTAGSGVERSTSGGTSVISPIISRGPSTTIPNASVRTVGGRARTPSLPEEGDDMGSRPISLGSAGTPKQTPRNSSPPQATSVDHGEASSPPTFIPGHRRDLSTPSPNNSPARTPALEANKLLHQPQEAELAMSTPTEPSFARGAFQRDQAFEQESNASPTRTLNDPRKRSVSPSKSRVRDLAGKFESASSSRRGSDQSLSQRGGSGATSPQRTDMPAPNRPFVADRMESFRPHLPGAWDSYVSNAPPAEMNSKGVNDRDASPLREESRPSKLDHTGLAAFEAGRAPASSGAHEQENRPSLKLDNRPEDGGIFQPSSTVLGSKGRSSPDPSRTPRLSGDTADKDTYPVTSTSSNPAKVDHPEIYNTRPARPLTGAQTPEKAKEAPDYFQSITSVGAGEAPSEQPTLSTRPSILTPLSTDGGSQYESDRLRREIVKSLTPDVQTEPTTAESDSPYQDRLRGPIQTDVLRHGPAHESMVIPREYDSYWNGSESTSSTRSNSQHVTKVTPSAIQRNPDSPRDGDKVASPTSNILSPRLQRLVSEPRVEDQRPTAPHRFSWDRASSTEEPSQDLQQDAQSVDLVKRPVEQNSLDSPTIGQAFERDGTGLGDGNILGEPEEFGDRPPANFGGSGDAEYSPGRQRLDEISKLPGHGDGAFEPPARATEAGNATEHVPTPPQTAFRNTFNQDASLPPVPPPQSAQLKIPAFREISALKTPAERIRGYNDAREQFANLDSGLAEWIAVTAAELPEHADVLSNVGRAPAAMMNYKPSSSRLLTGLRSTRPRSDMPETAGSSFGQGSSPSGGSSKLATQQVQAKGKDLLHNAGVFGGKANVAAKGLFSKGRSRFRGGIGADKDSTPPSQPLVQPPTNVRNVDFNIQTSSLSEDQPSHARPLSYVQRVDALKSHGGGPETLYDETIPSSNFGSRDDSDGQTSVPNAQARAYPTRSDSLAPANSHAIERFNEDSGQINTSGTTNDASDHCDQRQSATATTPISQASPDRDFTGSGSRTPTQVDFEDRVHSSPQSDKRTPPPQHFASQPESLRDAIGPSTRHEPSLPKLLSIPTARFSTEQADSADVTIGSEVERSIAQQSGAERYSEDSNRTFHTAEDGNDDRPESRQTQDDVETPKAAEPPPLTFQNVPSQHLAALPPSQADNPSELRDLGTASGKLSQPPSSPEMRAHLAREPSLDAVSSVVQSDLPPSPVSPQRSFIQEPARPDNRKGPIYYDPSHDFGPASNDRVLAAAYNSPRQHSRGPSLVDHPAFRRDASPALRSQKLAEQNAYGRGRDEAPSRQHPDMESDLSSGVTSRNRTNESTPDAKRKSRNSGFFKAFKSPIGIADQANGESDQIDATPTGVSVDGQRKSKRNSLFGSRNVDDRNNSGQSEESPPAPIPRVDTMRPQIPGTPDSKGSSSPSSGGSNNLRNRLQRASTSGKKENENGKKKRFSALGSLFGSRSRKTQPSAPEQSRPSQPVTFYQFGPPQQSQANERKLHQPLSQQHPEHPESRPSFQPSSPNPSSAQSRYDLVPGQGSDQRPHEEYYAPARSDHKKSQGSTTAWSQSVQRISQATSTNEPPAYAQDAALRHRSTAPPEGPSLGASRASTTIPRSVTSNSPSTRSRSSMWSRSQSREVPLSKRHDRSTSGNSWTTTAQEQSRQSTYTNPVSQSSQPALSPRPGITPTHSNQGRVLTFSQFGDSSISYPPTQPATNIPPSGSHQPSPVRQQRQSVVTFQQFPQNRSTREDSPPPPPPPPKDDGHVSRPRQSMIPQVSNPQQSQEQTSSHNPRSSYAQHPSAEYPSSTGQQTRHDAPSSYIQQPVTEYQPTPNSQPRTFLEQPPAPSHSRTASYSSQSQRQNLPPLQTEVPNARSSTFSPGNTSAESRKARQRELEMGGRPNSAIRSAPTETATGAARKGEDAEDVIVMSSSSYPGMEWTPDRWEDDYTL